MKTKKLTKKEKEILKNGPDIRVFLAEVMYFKSYTRVEQALIDMILLFSKNLYKIDNKLAIKFLKLLLKDLQGTKIKKGKK